MNTRSRKLPGLLLITPQDEQEKLNNAYRRVAAEVEKIKKAKIESESRESPHISA